MMAGGAAVIPFKKQRSDSFGAVDPNFAVTLLTVHLPSFNFYLVKKNNHINQK